MYIDIHCHIIPGIDDGAQNYDVALNMLRIAQENGTRKIIATPHFVHGTTRYGFSTIKEKCVELNQLAQNHGIDIGVYPGFEVFITPELIDLYEQKLIETLAASEYMLIEFPMMSIPAYTDDILYKLQLKGVTPIIAHPERYSEIQNNLKLLENFVMRGVQFQVNSGSITGMYGRESKKTALKLIEKGLIHFIASDAHSYRTRSPDLSQAAKVIEKKFGAKLREDLFTNNPMKIIKAYNTRARNH